MDAKPDNSAIAAYATSQLDPSLTWDIVDWLASITRLPIIVKGILRADDALRAFDHGATAIVVSNHGGRQLDTTPATIQVLPAIVDAVGHRGEVYMDGGIRRGTDVIKALALGAKTVWVGRPIFWGLSVNGEQGVIHVLDILLKDFTLSMSLCGCQTTDDITLDLIFDHT
jgi:4-hydroxymandelate oxidase